MKIKKGLTVLILFPIVVSAMEPKLLNTKDNSMKNDLRKELHNDSPHEDESISYRVTIYERIRDSEDKINGAYGVFNDDSVEIKETGNKRKYQKITSYNVKNEQAKLNKFNDYIMSSSENNDRLLSKSFMISVNKIDKFTYTISRV